MRRTRMIRGALPLLAGLLLGACGTNPVTGKKEIQFVSEAQEVQTGQQNYAPMRQAEGGDYNVVPELTVYVNEVGQKLAAVSERQLPYEFVVLNNSTPNAWALPGGKIAVNRGLLTALTSESELAAVIGHEIVHAAARHGAKAQERGTLMQAGMAAAQIGAAASGVDPNIGNLVLSGGAAGLQMVQMKYGRDQELEADEYGMKYMKLVGYDVQGAVTLQETFVRLFNQGAKEQDWLEGLFASHPPSQERVDRNRVTAEKLGRGGFVGDEAYAARVKPLIQLQPAYDKYDQALAAAKKKDFAAAKRIAAEGARLAPKDSGFPQLLGQIALAEKQPKEALAQFQKATQLNPGYYGGHLGTGIAAYQSGNKSLAATELKQSTQMLPTAPAAYYLGTIARDQGDTSGAVQYFKAAAQSNSSYGKQASAELARLELNQNPGSYVATALQRQQNGRVAIVVQNRANVPLANIVLTPVQVNANGQVVQQGQAVRIAGPVQPGQQAGVDAGIGAVADAQLASIKVRVDSANVAQ